TLDHRGTGRVVVEALARAMGVTDVHVMDPIQDPGGFQATVKACLDRGFSVHIDADRVVNADYNAGICGGEWIHNATPVMRSGLIEWRQRRDGFSCAGTGNEAVVALPANLRQNLLVPAQGVMTFRHTAQHQRSTRKHNMGESDASLRFLVEPPPRVLDKAPNPTTVPTRPPGLGG
ncbi:MAG: hypothetical protein N2483_09135, partial [Burkholderiaceae bacterium]|nr:hypothetical protein [Burkholderiaceae bacterium]